MGFKDIKHIPKILDSSSNNLVEEFFNPVLSQSLKYDRGVGYFTSGWLTSVAKGVIPLVEEGGRIRLITSPNLQQRDYDAIVLGDKARQDKTIFNALSRDVSRLSKDLEDNVRVALSWMIADKILDIKIAVPRNKLSGGDFHVKFGIFTDLSEDKILFMGSYNDTEHANLNYEEIAVFKSYEMDGLDLVNQKELLFNRLWADEDPNIRVFDIPDIYLRHLLDMKGISPRPYRLPLKQSNIVHETKLTFQPRPYQKEAITNWFNAGCKGILEMATGTGKTKTSLCASLRLREQHSQLLLVVALPTATLAEQWLKEVQNFGYNTLLCSSSNPNWKNEMVNALVKLNFDSKRNFAFICTHNSLKSEEFNQKLARIDKTQRKVLLLADECHHLGSEGAQKSDFFDYDFTLGLSATPERFFDDEGSSFVKAFLGKVVFKYTLRDAIEAGYLCPYEYHIHEVFLSEEEMTSYIEISKKISRMVARGGYDKDGGKFTKDVGITQLLNKRANILKTAKDKIRILRDLLVSNKKIDHAVIFCAPNTNELDLVSTMLHDINLISHRFTGEENDTKILEDFDKGVYQILTAMNIFNEGVDIPSAKEAYILSSSSNPTEFIQRRGRVLRENPNFLKERAIIHDFVVLPAIVKFDIAAFEKKIIQREIERCYLFAEDALNNFTVMERLNILMTKYVSLPTYREVQK